MAASLVKVRVESDIECSPMFALVIFSLNMYVCHILCEYNNKQSFIYLFYSTWLNKA